MKEILNVRIPGDQTVPEEWERWFLVEGFRLAQCGIPEAILKDKYLWRDLFANGQMEYSGYSEFSADDIPNEQIVTLKMVLEASYPKDVLGEVDLYILICRRLGIDPTPT